MYRRVLCLVIYRDSIVVSVPSAEVCYTMSCMRRCRTCQTPIANARSAALPGTTTCVACSTEQPVRGWMEWSHKTAPVFQVVTPTQYQWLHAHDRKGMRSGLPLSSRGSAASALPVAYTPPRATSTPAHNQSPGPLATTCAHPDRPQVSAAGKCLECAVDYYHRRAAFTQELAEKKVLHSR